MHEASSGNGNAQKSCGKTSAYVSSNSIGILCLIRKVINMKKIHLICNAHLDPIWQWNWDEGISAAIATFKSAADLADEFDYVFCHGESLLYETIEKNVPELFKRIQKLVKKGKWHISGGWYLQPDCLMPSGETMIRNVEEGRRYFKEKFGKEPIVATNYDSFGHSIGLVQIMAKNGYKGYLICRPKKDVQTDYPSKFFRWTGPDGSSIVVSNSATYNSLLGQAAEKIRNEACGNETGMLGAEAAEKGRALLENTDYVLWGVGNHGGGPSRKDLKDISELNITDTEIIHSTPEDLFADNIEIKGEKKTSLVTCNPGCYSSMARVKHAFRRTENLFYATEKMIFSAMQTGFKTDMSELKQAEKKLLLATFHDILPGSCVHGGEKEGLGLLSSCEKTLIDIRTNAFLYLTMNEPCAKEGEFPVFVFNYSPFTIESLIEAEFSLADQNWSEDTVFVPHVFDENGTELLCQQIKEDSTLNLDWRKRIIFEGKLNPLGITRFSVKVSAERKEKKNAVKKDIYELLQNNTLLKSPVTLEIYDDTADPWGMSEKELIKMGENPEPFRLMTKEETEKFCAINGGIDSERIIENGEIATVFESLCTSGATNAAIQYKFYKNKPYTDIKVVLEFADKNKLVKLRIPVPEEFQEGKTVGDGPYVWEEKPDCEISFQKWAGIKKGQKIFAVINDCSYAGSCDGKYIYVTLIRGAGYCFHPIGERELYPQDRYLPRIDCGRYEYGFRLFIGNVYDVCKTAEDFNQPPYAVNEFPIGGKAYEKHRFEIEGNVILSAIQTDANGKHIARIYNPSENTVDYIIKKGDKIIKESISGREFVSLFV